MAVAIARFCADRSMGKEGFCRGVEGEWKTGKKKKKEGEEA
jgi:hypothetical protein